MFLLFAMLLVFFYIHMNYLLFLFGLLSWRTSKAVPTMKQWPKVSVIIPTRDDENVIGETLRRLKDSYPKNRMEIIVVDYSSDNTAKIAKKYARVIIAKKPHKSYALNLGVKKARHELIYFLDADSLVEKNTIKMLVADLLLNNSTVAGISLPINKGSLIERLGRARYAFLSGLEIGTEELLHTTLIPGKNFMIRKSIVKKVKGFSDVLSEDVNFSMKLYMFGEKVRLIPAYCYEQVPDKAKHYWLQQVRWTHGSFDEIKMIVRHLSFFELTVLLPYVILRALAPALSVILLLLSLVLGDYFILSAALIGLSIFFITSIKFLEGYDIALFPLTAIIYGFLDLSLLLTLPLNPRRKWYKTPKNSYGPSKSHSGHT